MRADIVAILSRMFPHETVVVEEMLRTNWATDEYSMGSFSFPAVGYVPLREMDSLQLPVGRMHWAGEHTSRYFYQKMGTVGTFSICVCFLKFIMFIPNHEIKTSLFSRLLVFSPTFSLVCPSVVSTRG